MTLTNDQPESSNDSDHVEGHSDKANSSSHCQQENSANPSTTSDLILSYEKNTTDTKKENIIPESKTGIPSDNQKESTHNENDHEESIRKNNSSYIKSSSNTSSNSIISENKSNNINTSTNKAKILRRSKMNIDENELQDNLVYEIEDNDDNNINVTKDNNSLAKTIEELNNKIPTSSIKSFNNMCHHIVSNDNQKVVHIRNNKLLIENKELREKVRMLNEKLAYHQYSGKSLESLKKKLPPLMNANENSKCSEYGKQKKYTNYFKLPTIQNGSISIVEVKDNGNNSSITKFKSSIPKSKMPIISRKNNNIISKPHESSLNKINNNGINHQ